MNRTHLLFAPLALVMAGTLLLFGTGLGQVPLSQSTNPRPIIVDQITRLENAVMQLDRRLMTLEKMAVDGAKSTKALEKELKDLKARTTAAEDAAKKLKKEFDAHAHAGGQSQ